MDPFSVMSTAPLFPAPRRFANASLALDGEGVPEDPDQIPVGPDDQALILPRAACPAPSDMARGEIWVKVTDHGLRWLDASGAACESGTPESPLDETLRAAALTSDGLLVGFMDEAGGEPPSEWIIFRGLRASA